MKPARIALGAALATLPAFADVVQQRQAVADLLVASVAARAVVSVSIDECTARYAQLVEPALDAKMEWDARNTPLEERARALANRMASGIDASTGAAGYEAFRKSLLAKAQADATGQVRERVTKDLAAQKPERRLAMCRELVAAVHSGKMDFPVTQPNAYRLLQDAK
jgi:hypothetical protein